jgi:O-succinylbenzoic acid--CoA ligase
MIFSVREAAAEMPHNAAVVTRRETVTFAELAERVDGRQPDFEGADRRIPFPHVCAPDLSALATLFACFEARLPVALISPRLSAAERNTLVKRVETFRLREDALAVVFTSGTSAQPKAVELSRGAMAAAAAASAERLGWRADDRWLLSLSYAHLGGLSILTRCLLARRPCVLAEEGGPFSASEFVEALSWGEATLASLVPVQLAQVLDLGRRPPPRLRAVLLGGAAASTRLLSQAADLGWPVLATYGLTETCAQVATQLPGTSQRGELGCGPPLDGVELRIAEGRIQVRSQAMLSAYHPPHLFPSPLTADGWLETGDLGHLDGEGRLHVLGRSDEVIVTGGEKVLPERVEEALLQCPGVSQAAVFAVPDPTWGALVAAAIVPSRTPVSLDPLRSAIAERLASFERPRLVAFVTELPRTASGKVLRRTVASACEGRLEPLRYGSRSPV